MAVAYLSSLNTFLSLSSNNSISPSSCSSTSSFKHNAITQTPLCIRASGERESAGISSSLSLGKRGFSLSLSSAFLLSLAGGNHSGAEAAVLEAEDDLELLEKVKKDRKRRIENQKIINSSKTETGYLQHLVYKLSEVGQAIDKNDLNAASSVLGTSTNVDWLKKANSAFTKLTSSPEEKAEVDVFNSSISQLISSVAKKDMESSKIAFVSSASALEKWTALTGLDDQLKGL